MTRQLIALTALVTIACQAPAGSGRAAPPAVRFEVRGLKSVFTPASTGGGGSYSHRATVVAHAADSVVARLPYTVCYTVRRISGGDPASPRDASAATCAFVNNGVGDLEVYSGYRLASESWEPEKIELVPLAFDVMFPMSGPAIAEQ
jgi:hypothetical protein